MILNPNQRIDYQNLPGSVDEIAVPDRAREVQFGLISQLYYRAYASLIGMPLCAIVIAFAVRGNVNDTTLLSWVLLVLTLTLVRAVVIHRYGIADDTEKRQMTWLYRYWVIEFFSGVLWGLTALSLSNLPPHLEMVVYLGLAGMLMGAAMLLATSVIAFIAFSVPAGGLFAVISFLQNTGEIHALIAGLVILFTFVVIFVTRVLNRDIQQSLSLALDNAQLLAHVQKANTVLRKEIQNHEQSKRQISQTRDELSRIFDNMQDTYFRTDGDGNFVALSPSVKELLQFEITPLIKTPFSGILQFPDQYTDLIERLETNNGFIKNYEAPIVRQDGRIIWVSTNARYYFDSDGHVAGIEGTIRDISDSKVAAQALVKAKDEYKRLFEFNRHIIEHAPFGIVTISKNNQFTYINPAMSRLAGVPEGETSPIIGQNFANVASIREAGLIEKGIALSKGRTFHTEVPFRSIYGKESHIEITGVPLFENGEYNGSVVMINDISERKKTEEALRLALDKADEANKAKTEFIANINHELRTPLNGIIGMAEILQREITDESLQDGLKIIQTAGQHLLELVNQVLDLAKIESGAMEKYVSAVDVPRILQVELAPLVLLAHQKQLEFIIDCDPEVPHVFFTDATWLKQILINLASNAIKFTHKGSVTIRVIHESDDALYFQIIDTGIGIDSDKLSSIFDRFYQAHDVNNTQYRGTGLGTTIAKELTEALGGRIWVESQPDAGTQFHVRLPSLAPPSNTEASDEIRSVTVRKRAPLHKTSLNILVAEDNEVNQLVIRKMLNALGHSVELVDNGQSAFEKVRDDSFDLVIMDIQMPILNGLESTKKIRALPDSNKSEIPIIALTALMLKEDKLSCISAGMNACLAKPLHMESLKQALSDFIA